MDALQRQWPVSRRTAALAGLLIALVVAGIMASAPSVDSFAYRAAAALALAAFAAAAAATAERSRRTPSERAGWILITAAIVVWGVSAAMLNLYELQRGERQRPLDADLLGLAAYPLIIGALVSFWRALARRHPGIRALDGMVAAGAVIAVATPLVLTPTWNAIHSVDNSRLIFLNQIGDVLIAATVVGLLVALHGIPDRRPYAFLVGATAAIVADLLALGSTSRIVDVQANTLGNGLAAAIAVVTLTALALAAMTEPQPSAEPEPAPQVVLGFAALAFGVLLLHLSDVVPGEVGSGAYAAAVTVGLALVRLSVALRENEALEQEGRLSVIDELTGAANRRALMRALEDRIKRNERFTAVLFDLDGFKRYNDTLGHVAGDELLRAVARSAAAAVGSPSAFRLGGDEFLLLLRDDLESDEELRALLARVVPAAPQGAPTMRASAGVVRSQEDHPRQPIDVLLLADERMYADKRVQRAAAERDHTVHFIELLLEHAGFSLAGHPEATLAAQTAVRMGLGVDAAQLAQDAMIARRVGILARGASGTEASTQQAMHLFESHPAMEPIQRVLQAALGEPPDDLSEAEAEVARIVGAVDLYDSRDDHELALAEIRAGEPEQFSDGTAAALTAVAAFRR